MAQLVIRQFDVFETPPSRGAGAAPFLCILQSHYLEALNTVVVAPLIPGHVTPTQSQTAVPIVFRDVAYVLDTSLLANIERTPLRRAMGSLLEYEFDIRRALDRLFTGF